VNLAETVYRHFYRQRKREAENKRVAFSQIALLAVGNLTTGGTGKTPAVQRLARRLQQEKLKVAVVGRGYGGEYSARGAIVSDGERIFLDAREAGDEAVLHARALSGVPVVIGRDRVAAVKMAIEKFSPAVVVLDDAFQYWSLARDFDLVLLDARRPFGNGKLLPAGRLREPEEELRRAGGVLLTRADEASAAELHACRNAVKNLTSAPIFHASHVATAWRDEASGERQALEALSGQRVAAFSAVADNAAFFNSLAQRGLQLASTLARRDHHQWRESEIRKFAQAAKAQGAAAIVTTEKDAVKITPRWTQPLPLYSVVIELQIENEFGLWELIRSLLVRKNLVPEF
jgi:tetraacyldisaccharide 4'-kinase